MKKLFALALVALSFLSFAPVAMAQPYGTWAYCNGVYRFGNCGGPTQQQMQQQQQQYRPLYVQSQQQYYGNQPQYVQQMPSGTPGFINNCSVIGGVVGGVAGNRIDHHGLGGTIAGALLGGAIGNLVCTNNQGQRIVYAPQSQYREEFANPPRYSGDVTGQQQLGTTDGYPQRPRARHYPADCDIGGHPELQNLDVPPEKCEAIRNALNVKDAGHCKIGGKNYPDLVDNEPECLSKKKELTVNKPAEFVFSSETAGAGVCRLRSDGSARLKSDPSQQTTQGQVIAVSEKTNDSGNAVVVPSNQGEDCNAWRRRAANQLVWKG